MFDISFSEIIVIAVVMLIVVGPERLPRVARMAGLLFGRAHRYVNDMKAEIDREIQLDELKRLKAEMEKSALALEQNFEKELETVEKTLTEDLPSMQSLAMEGLPEALPPENLESGATIIADAAGNTPPASLPPETTPSAPSTPPAPQKDNQPTPIGVA